jgi:uncharacterized protein
LRVVLDTNVLMSGIFFGGIPGRLLIAWREKMIQFVVSDDILDEYRQVAIRLSECYPEIDISNIVDILAQQSERVEAQPLSEPVSVDPDDDKFLACAFAGGVDRVVSGDSDLLSVQEFRGIPILTPRAFMDELSD